MGIPNLTYPLVCTGLVTCYLLPVTRSVTAGVSWAIVSPTIETTTENIVDSGITDPLSLTAVYKQRSFQVHLLDKSEIRMSAFR